MRAVGAGRTHRSIAASCRTSLSYRLTAGIEEDVDRGFAEWVGVGECEELDAGRLGEDLRPDVAQDLLDAACQLHAFVDLRRLAADEREAGPAANRVAGEAG